MAEAAPKPKRQRRNRKAANVDIDVAVGTSPNPATPQKQKRRRRRGPNPWPIGVRSRRFVRREVKRELKTEGLEGPKVAVQQKVSSTFGFVGPNTTGNTELELNFFCHPSLAKEPNDGTAFGPLQALAAQYSLWKLKYLTLRFTPMVGASAVSGTVVRASLNLSQSPGGSNWSGLGTRIHMDMHPGQATTFHLRGSQIGGPRDGGWWFTDTNEEGSQSAGPIIEVHTLGKTNSTFTNQEWTDNLFLVEGFGVWQFSNYQVKQALGSLERRVGDAEVTVTAEAGQPITMEMDDTNEVAMFMNQAEPEVTAVPSSSSVGETIFQVVDVGAEMAQKIAPPPFSWLIKGGWWFVKKILGRARAGKSTYAIYASLSDAQNNKPAICSASKQLNSVTTKLMVTQINSPNVGPSGSHPSTLRATPITMPFGPFRLHSEMVSELVGSFSSGSTQMQIPIAAIPGNKTTKPAAGTAPEADFLLTPWWIGYPGRAPTAASYFPGPNTGGYVHSLYRLVNPRFTDSTGQIEYYPPPPLSGLNFCMTKDYSASTPGAGNPYAVYGQVVAATELLAGTTPPLSMVLTLIKTTAPFTGSTTSVPNLYIAVADNNAMITFTNVNKQGFTVNERSIPQDAYLLAVAYTNTVETINGVPVATFFKLQRYPRNDTPGGVVFPYNYSGQMIPPTSVDLRMIYYDKPVVDAKLVEQLKLLQVPFAPQLPLIQEIEEEVEAQDSSDSGSDDSENTFWDDIAANAVVPRVPRRWLKDGKIAELRPV